MILIITITHYCPRFIQGLIATAPAKRNITDYALVRNHDIFKADAPVKRTILDVDPTFFDLVIACYIIYLSTRRVFFARGGNSTYHDRFKASAPFKRITTNAGNTVRNDNRFKAETIAKRRFPNAFDTITYHDRFKAAAPIKRILTNASNTVRNHDRLQIAALVKRIAPNAARPLGDANVRGAIALATRRAINHIRGGS